MRAVDSPNLVLLIAGPLNSSLRTNGFTCTIACSPSASGLALISSSLCAVVGLRVLVGLSAIHLEMVCVMRPIVLGVLVAAILIAILVYAVLDGIDLHGHIVPSVPNMRALTATGTTTLAIRLYATSFDVLGHVLTSPN